MAFYNLSEKGISNILIQLGYKPPPDLLSRNLEYYLKRTSHGSTLSRLVYADLAYRTMNYELSWTLYQEALCSDFQDIQGGTTREGIHLGVMTGTIVFLYKTYAGLNWVEDLLSINPRLPEDLQEMSFRIRFRDESYYIGITQEKVKVKLDSSNKKMILINDKLVELIPEKWIETGLKR